MKNNMMKHILLVSLFLGTGVGAFAQVFTNKEVGKKNQELSDSLKQAEYPYVLPIWGDKATKAGFSLPYSAGLSVQYFGQESSLIIENLEVGFNNSPMYNLDGIVRFDESKAKATAVTVRPDIWLFPFLNVYGIFGMAQASTNVNFGVWVPNGSGSDQEIFSTGTVVEFKTTTFGLGMTPTIGVGGGFLALDMNMAWTDVPQLSQPARSFVFGPRFGKNFKLKKPEQSVAIWVGGFRVAIRSGTDGSINLSEILPEGFGGKVDEAIVKVGEAQEQVDAWWDGLTQQEQNNPVNKAKHETADATLERVGGILSAADDALNNVASSSVKYSMDKQVKDAWNFIVGGQFQLNKHLMFRSEVGFLGSRKQLLAGVQYRFGL